MKTTHDFEGRLSCFFKWHKLCDAPRGSTVPRVGESQVIVRAMIYVHLAVGRWIYNDALARGIILGCQLVVCRASVDKQALVRRRGVHIYPDSGWTKSACTETWEDGKRCEENGNLSLMRRRWQNSAEYAKQNH